MKILNNKTLGATLSSDDWNQLTREMENIIESQSITLSNLSLDQAATAISEYSSQGDYYDSAAGSNDYVLTVISSKIPVESYIDGMRIRFTADFTNTGAATVDVIGLGQKAITFFDQEPLVAGEIVSGTQYTLLYRSVLNQFLMAEQTPPQQGINGGLKDQWHRLVCVASNQINFISGVTIDSTDSILMSGTTRVKDLDVVWSSGGLGGRASGAPIAANQTWYAFVIMRTDGLIDFGFDTNRNGSLLLADASDYTFIRGIGVFITDGVSDIRRFIQYGDIFRFFTFVFDTNSLTAGTNIDLAIGVPSMGSLHLTNAILQVCVDDSTGNEERTLLTLLNPDDEIQTFTPAIDDVNSHTDLVGQGFVHAGESVTGTARMRLYPSSDGKLKFCPRSQFISNAAMEVQWTVISYEVDRRALQL